MKEHKELIYAEEGERIELFPPMAEQTQGGQSEAPALPRRQGRLFSGLAVCVTLFAAAFLLCDGAYALRARADEALTQSGAPSHWLTDSFLGTVTASTAPIVTGAAPQTETSAAIESTTAAPTATATSAQETTSPPPALTPEELYTYDASAVPQGMIPIVPRDLSLIAYGESFHYNDTSYSTSLDRLPAADGAIPAGAGAGEVSVLILHTHATEGYSGEGATYYDPSTPLARADDPAEGVIAVGDVIADILNENGIITLHSTILHDKESYKDSYSRSAQTVQSYLAQYPSIRLVIDVHRDSIMTSGDQLVRPVTVVEGEAVAQVMCVVGSDASGTAHENWHENLALAARLRSTLNSEYGNLCRPIYIKRSAYNQQYAPASLLLEIGSSGNSLAEAERAAALVAEKIAEMMK